MKKLILSIAAIAASIQFARAQNPLPTIGPWILNSGTSQTNTVHNAGVGTTTPAGKMEVKYQPCVSQQNGLIVTSLGCSQLVSTYNPINLDGVIPFDFIGPWPPPVPLSFSVAYTVTSVNIPIINANNKPMFWVRDENPVIPGLPGVNTITYDTKFIIMPNGNTGINTSNPRGTFDVVQFSGTPKNEPTAIFGKIAGGTQTVLTGTNEGGGTVTDPSVYGYRTKQIMIYNNLGAKSYNRIVQDKDQAILFTDGLNSNGSNQNGALVIAPWDPNYTLGTSTVGGIRIDKDGKVEIHGALRATDLDLNAKWWSDFVFKSDYKLMSLDSLSGFIKTYGHLPDMPSEKEVLDSGINVADMQALQQQKIEELTLYTIGQQQEILTLKTLLEEQLRRQTELEKKLADLLKN